MRAADKNIHFFREKVWTVCYNCPKQPCCDEIDEHKMLN